MRLEWFRDKEKLFPMEEVSKEEYLNSLSPRDRGNITAVIAALSRTSSGTSSCLLAVGGSVISGKRGTPRKDIDLILLADGGVSFEDAIKIANEIAQKTGFEIAQVIEPIPDFDFPDFLLRRNGSVVMQPSRGTPIELISEPKVKSWQEELRCHRTKASTIPQAFTVLL